MPALLTELETQLDRRGLMKRDFGVAVAVAFLSYYETATGRQIAEDSGSQVVRRIVYSMKSGWKTKYAALNPAVQERFYVSLLSESYPLSQLSNVYTKTGNTEETALFRRNAASLFKRLTGKTPTQISIGSDGRIAGLGTDAGGGKVVWADKTAGRSPAGKSAAAKVLGCGGAKLALDSVILRSEQQVGLGGLSNLSLVPYILLRDGRTFDAPAEALGDRNADAEACKNPTLPGAATVPSGEVTRSYTPTTMFSTPTARLLRGRVAPEATSPRATSEPTGGATK
ncbi:MAG: hypothetical protein H7145_19555 [Akkermansiaceae bacterium]|nr:hypothetical protein [Armatimonadota bacterium]